VNTSDDTFEFLFWLDLVADTDSIYAGRRGENAHTQCPQEAVCKQRLNILRYNAPGGHLPAIIRFFDKSKVETTVRWIKEAIIHLIWDGNTRQRRVWPPV